MKNAIEMPKIEIVAFDREDVITTSATTSAGGGIELPDDNW